VQRYLTTFILQVVGVLYLCSMAKQARRSDCPINYGLEIFGDKWTLLIVRDLIFKGKHSYGEFLKSEEKIATNILADRLLQLENAGIVIKNADPAHGSKFIYKLTQKGIDLLPVLVELIMWSARYDSQTAADVAFVEAVEKDKVGVLTDISNSLKNELI
jgi:DNA-binding HxlR family transcriptional regulator